MLSIVVLLSANLLLLFSDRWSNKSEVSSFFGSEELQTVQLFTMTNARDTIRLEKVENGWLVNGTKADDGFMNTLFSILERIEVGRSIESWQDEPLGKVVLSNSEGEVSFDYASNPRRTRSYFITGNNAKEVGVPGYKDLVIDLFELHPDQWRDRLIVDGSWRSIQKLTLVNEKGSDFEIVFNNTFFNLNGEAPKDSSSVVNYLDQFQQFQANEMISDGRFEALDSLGNTQPVIVLTIDDIKYASPIRLEIFPSLPGQAYHLVKNKEGEKMVLDAQRVRGILRGPD